MTRPLVLAAWTPISQFAARPDEEAHLDPALAAERDHGADLVVGLQHDAAALTDAVDRYAVRVRLGHDRLHDARPFARRDLDPVLTAVGEPLARGRQLVRVALRQVEPGENVTCVCASRLLRVMCELNTEPAIDRQRRADDRRRFIRRDERDQVRHFRGRRDPPERMHVHTCRSAAAGSGCIRNQSSTSRVRVQPGSTALTRMLSGA